MNQEKNLRYQETDRRIRQAYRNLLIKMSAEKISIAGICQAAGINRSSFYLHYIDQNDLISAMIADLQNKLLRILTEAFRHPLNINDYILEYLRLVQENQELLSLNGFQILHNADVRREFKKTGTALGVSNERELNYHLAFFFGGLEQLTFVWVQNGCQEPPEYLIKLIDDEYHKFSAIYASRV